MSKPVDVREKVQALRALRVAITTAIDELKCVRGDVKHLIEFADDVEEGDAWFEEFDDDVAEMERIVSDLHDAVEDLKS